MEIIICHIWVLYSQLLSFHQLLCKALKQTSRKLPSMASFLSHGISVLQKSQFQLCENLPCHRKLTSQNIKLYFQSCYAKYLKCQPGILVYEPLVKCLILRWALSTSQDQLHSTILSLSRPTVLYLYITLKECSAFWTYKVVRCFLVQRETAISAHVLCGPYYHPLVYNVILLAVLYFTVHIVVTCRLQLWQWPGSFTCYCGDMWWNKYQNKESVLPPLQPGLEPTTICSWVQCSTTELPHPYSPI